LFHLIVLPREAYRSPSQTWPRGNPRPGKIRPGRSHVPGESLCLKRGCSPASGFATRQGKSTFPEIEACAESGSNVRPLEINCRAWESSIGNEPARSLLPVMS